MNTNNTMTPSNNNIDQVYHPDHYTKGRIECLDAIESATGDEYTGYLQGNIIKYIWRFRHKDGVTDLRKAEFYLNRLIKYIQTQQDPELSELVSENDKHQNINEPDNKPDNEPDTEN